MPTWRELLDASRAALADPQDLNRIAQRASGWSPAELVRHLDERVAARTRGFYDTMIERRAAGEPLQYVLGEWGFRTLDLFVDRRVLIPRPETETVVDVALAELRRMELIDPVIVDLGTGSGAIALACATEVADAIVWATDASTDALAVARANLAGQGGNVASRVRIAEGDWFDALPGDLRGRVALVVSNPPYVADDEALPDEVRAWEPAAALRAGPTGLEDIERIVRAAPQWLARPGALVVELAPHQADHAVDVARAAGATHASVEPDLTGRARALVARWC